MTDRARAAARSNLLMTPLVAVSGLVATVAVVRGLAPSDFAIYAVILAFKGTVQFASDFGTGAAATRLFGELQARGAAHQARRAYARLLAIRGLIALALVVGVALFTDTFVGLLELDPDERDIVVLLVAIGVAESVSSLGYSVLAGTLRHGWINRTVLVSTVVQPMAVIAAAASGLGLMGITAGLLLGSLLRSGGFHLGALGVLRAFDDHQTTQVGVARSYMRTATGSIAGKVAAWVHSRQLVTLIAIQTAPRVSVAVFALAYDLLQQVAAALTSPFTSLLLPLQAANAGDDERARRVYRTAVRLIALVVVPAACVFVALLPSLSDVLFGDVYRDVALYALILVPAIAAEAALAAPATALMLADDRVLTAYTRIKAVTLVLGVAYVVLASADLLIIAAIMTAIRLGSTGALLLVLRRRLGLRSGGSWVPRLMLVTTAAALAGWLPSLLQVPDVAALAIGAVAAAATAVLTMRRVRLIADEDAALARSLVPALGRLIVLLSPPRTDQGSSRAA